MYNQAQNGRTMLETMMVMGLMGVLSVTGVYMYRQAMNDVRADAIVKDVLARASQTKNNEDLKKLGAGKRVYTPEYKKTTGVEDAQNTTKGRYGYTYKIVDANTADDSRQVKEKSGSEYVVIELVSTVTPAVCNSVKGKLKLYSNNYPKIIYMGTTKYLNNNVDQEGIIENCNELSSSLYFTIKYR